MRLTGATSALIWQPPGFVLSSPGWDVPADEAAGVLSALRNRASEMIPSGDPALRGIEAPVAGDCDRFVFLALDGEGVDLLLGLAPGQDLNATLDLAALAHLVAAAVGQSADRSFDAAQLYTVREIVSGIAHDVGTPLNVISGYSEYLLMSGGEDARGRKEIATILDQTRRIAAMIRQMLDTVRTAPGDSGRTRPLGAFSDESLQVATYMLRKAQVKCQIDGEAPSQSIVSGDLPLLYQAVFAVLSSAARAVGASGKLVLRPVAGAETGVGIEIEGADAAGNPVDLAPLASSQVDDGTTEGLGQLLVDRVLGAHGGALLPISNKEGDPARLLVRVGA